MRLYLSIWPSSNNNMIHYHLPIAATNQHKMCPLSAVVERVTKDRAAKATKRFVSRPTKSQDASCKTSLEHDVYVLLAAVFCG